MGEPEGIMLSEIIQRKTNTIGSQFSSVAQSCLTLCDSMDVACQAYLSFTVSQRLLKFMSIESVMLSKYLILCRPLLLLPLISTLGFPVHCRLPELAQTHVHQVCDPMFFICHEKQMGFHLFWKPNILCCPCLLLPSIFPQIRIFSNEPVLRIR